ncbi:penicillin-binding transpeptidase domain-containing protein [Kitasatospora sp. HPMI-4]|uniref:penicillin-binding transpeptidase domain-containing protein n=1 Tax=Kitasatospora sp. HPMI-4 TaxID=3448443 RepID=UPI003F1AD769
MHKGVKIGIGVVCTGMLSVAGYGVYNIAGAVMDGRTGQSDAEPHVRTATAQAPTRQQAEDGAKAFLAAWAKGDLKTAAALTDQPDAATAMLAAFQEKVGPSSIELTLTGAPTASGAPSPAPSTPAGQVPLTFRATVRFTGSPTPWSYDGTVPMVEMNDGKSAVHWAPTVIHPHLTPGRSISVRPLPASSATSLTDRDGGSLADYPSLQPLLGELADRVPQGAPGTAGTAVVITDDSGQSSQEKLFTVTEPKGGQKARLTIDGKLQAAAEKAVRQASGGDGKPASLVAVEPSTGSILAFANAPAAGQNRAFLGAIAPGSTMKVITAAALLESGVSADATMPCKQNYSVNGFSFKNDDDESGEGWSFSKDFAQSCNTAFIQQGMTTLTGSQLQDTARKFFGIGPTWKTGLKLSPAKVPAPGSATERAAQLIGQGQITMNSLTMASVAATVQNGTFHQPILIPGYDQVPAGGRLSSSTLKSLRRMMHLTVTSGTARSAMSGIGGDTGAKTGTAQVGGQSSDNSWFTAYRDNLAVAAEVQGGGHGSEAAAPAAATVLAVGNDG